MAAKTVENGEKFPKNNFNFSLFGGIFFKDVSVYFEYACNVSRFFVVREGSNFFLNIVI